jgi:hypothetical protein
MRLELLTFAHAKALASQAEAGVALLAHSACCAFPGSSGSDQFEIVSSFLIQSAICFVSFLQPHEARVSTGLEMDDLYE